MPRRARIPGRVDRTSAHGRDTGIPVFVLEVALGQFMKQGGITTWNIVPLFKGLGLASMVIVYFYIWKEVKSTGKMVYFTVLFSYVVLILLLLSEVTLPGALDGIYYLKLDWSKLAVAQVWINASTQILYWAESPDHTWQLQPIPQQLLQGCLHIGCDQQCDQLLCWLCGVFSIMLHGIRAENKQLPCNVAESGSGVVYIAYPKALIPLSSVWATPFSFMLLVLSLDGQFVASLQRVWTCPRCYLVCCIIDLSMVIQDGMYVFQLFDHFSTSEITLLWQDFWACVVVA
ncbi:hypothetical protein lerEdw1_012556 [Lerista edwardsae]|nr:hypothetical protein lerEdw1_012556 [Lerista edwardsae]